MTWDQISSSAAAAATAPDNGPRSEESLFWGSTCVFPALICSCEGKPEWKPSGDERQDVKNSEATSAVGRDISAHKGPLQEASGARRGRSATMGCGSRGHVVDITSGPGEAGQTHQGQVSPGELISPRVGRLY